MNSKPKALTILDIVTAVLFVIAVGMVFLYAPEEVTMGQVQRVFYFHIANAWLGMLGFIAAAVAGVLYLIKKDRKWDIVELAAVEISIVFLAVATITGSIWARPAWNTWWTWDPRLTTVTIMILIYSAYLMLRSGIEDPDRRARFGAVYALLGAVSVPLTFFSIRIYRTIHPVVIGAADPSVKGQFSMSAPMLQTMLFSLLVYSILFIDILWHRIRLGKLNDQVEQTKLKLSQ